MTRYLILFTAALLAPWSAMESQRPRDRDYERDYDRDEVTSRIDTVVPFNRGGAVDLSLLAGEIVVTAWDRPEAKINAFSERSELRLDVSSSRISIDERSRRGRGDSRYEVTVPAGTRVLMRSTSGDLSARGVKGEVEARSVSGDVEVEDAGPVTFESVSGDVTGRRLAGPVRSKSVSGDIELDGVTGDVDAETTSGDVILASARTKFVRAESVSGEITYNGTIDPSGRYEFHSHSGDIDLTLPEGVGAQLGVETFSGEIDTAFPLQLGASQRDGGRPRRFEFTLGKGGARITAETFSGNINLARGAPSK
jgi:DUF4097 and DUF4098 domain-containing protein YvlB